MVWVELGLLGDAEGNLYKSPITKDVVSGLWPEMQDFLANLSGHSPDATSFAEVSFGVPQ